MCATVFDFEAHKRAVHMRQRSFRVSAPPSGKEWLKKRVAFSRTCPAKMWSGSCQRQNNGELADASHQDFADSLDEMRSQASTTLSQSSWTNRMYLMQEESEIFGSHHEFSSGMSSICDHSANIAEIFAMTIPNRMSAQDLDKEHCQMANETSARPLCTNWEQGLSSLRFDVLSHSAEELTEICLEIFICLEIDKGLGIEKAALRNFIRHVRNQMNDNPYHNWYHVVDVVQSLYSIGLQCGIWDMMSSKERFCVMAAALCHDLDHPGVNNTFIEKTRSTLSSQADVRSSLLEKHHSLKATELMTNSHGTGLLDTLEPKYQNDILERIEIIILATNMSRHGEYVTRLRELIESRQDKPACHGFDEHERGLIAEVLIKCADMGNVLRPFPVAKKWAARITEEFFRQGDLELALGLDISPMCDRLRDLRVGLQQGFVRFVTPFYEAVVQLLPSLRPLVDCLDATRAGWEEGVSDEALLAEVPLLSM